MTEEAQVTDPSFAHIAYMYIYAGKWPGHGTRPSDERAAREIG